MTEMKITVIATVTEIINEIYNFNNSRIEKICAKAVNGNRIEVTFIADAPSYREQIQILKEFNIFLEECSECNNYEYERIEAIPAKFKKLTSYDEANMMFASNIPIEKKKVFIEILNCRNIGSMYYKSGLVNLVEFTLIANYEKVFIQSVPVSYDDNLINQLSNIGIMITTSNCNELIGKRFIGRIQSVSTEHGSTYIVTDADSVPEDYCLGGLIMDMDTI